MSFTLPKSLLPGVWFAGLCALFTVCALEPLHAHSDPRGDVHPEIAATKDGFLIRFRSNLYDSQLKDYRYMVHRKVYSLDGRLVLPRRSWKIDSPHADLSPLNSDPQYTWKPTSEPFHRVLTRKNQATTFPTSLRDGSEWEILLPDGSQIAPDIPWEELGLDFLYLETAWTDQKDFWLLLVDQGKADGKPRGGVVYERRPGLFLMHFPADQPGSVHLHSLGEPALIHHFARYADFVELEDGRLAFAWVEQIGTDRESYILNLTTMDSASGDVKTVKLSDQIDWNTTVAMAASGPHICVAWHWVEPRGSELSEIHTLFLNLENEEP